MGVIMAALWVMTGAGLAEAHPLIAAHRSLGPWAPTENSFSGLREAIAREIAVVEVDLRRTADGQVVLLHDSTVDRTTDGNGRIDRLTLRQVKALAMASGERVPTLDETLALARGSSTRLLLDIKRGGGVSPEQVVGIARRAGMIDRIMIGARSARDVGAYRALEPELPILGFVPRPADIDAFVSAGASAIRLWPKWIDHGQGKCRTDSGSCMIAALQERGLAVWVLADAPAERETARAMFVRLHKLQVDAILTDRPDLAAEAADETVSQSRTDERP
jgi:glycerophosphoryl diester phosphodiesterase